MSAVEGGSTPPPGWGGAEGTVTAATVPVSVSPVISTPRVVSGQPAAEAAVEYRIGAAVVDNLLLVALYGAICGLLHWRLVTLTHELLLLALDIAYHFVLESRDGQTIGKRMNGVQVVSLDGSQAPPKAIAIRSVLRIIDSIPIWYLSGLINMVRTGPERRQRIGDVAAETKVIAVEGRAVTRGTPGWVLPTVTLVALCASVLNVYAIATAGNRPLTSEQQASFVAGCERSSASGVIDCRCLLTRLEADGYTTMNSLKTVVEQARSEEFAGQGGAARNELTNDGLACRR